MSLLLLLKPKDTGATTTTTGSVGGFDVYRFPEERKKKKRKRPGQIAQDIQSLLEHAYDQLSAEPAPVVETPEVIAAPEPVEVLQPVEITFAARAIDTMPGPDFDALRAFMARSAAQYLSRQEMARQEQTRQILAEMSRRQAFDQMLRDRIRELARIQEDDEMLLLALLH